jgi:hypothetical protein
MTEKANKAAAPADEAAPAGAPPAEPAGAVGSDGGTGTPAGSPIIEDPEVADESATIMLKIAPPAEGAPEITSLATIDAEVVADTYRAFTPAQASALLDSAEAAGVTIIDQADEGGTGGTPSP